MSKKVIAKDLGYVEIEYDGKTYHVDAYHAVEMYDMGIPEDGILPLSQYTLNFVRNLLGEPELAMSSRAAFKVMEVLNEELADEKKGELDSTTPA